MIVRLWGASYLLESLYVRRISHEKVYSLEGWTSEGVHTLETSEGVRTLEG